MPLQALFAASVPSWVWATLLMALFVVVSAATMLLVRYPLRHLPRPDEKANRDSASEK